MAFIVGLSRPALRSVSQSSRINRILASSVRTSFEEQRRVGGLGERVGDAIGEVEPRLRIDAFAVTIERRERFARLGLVEGNDLEIYGMEAGTAALIYMILRNFENFDLVILTHLMGTPNRAVA